MECNLIVYIDWEELGLPIGPIEEKKFIAAFNNMYGKVPKYAPDGPYGCSPVRSDFRIIITSVMKEHIESYASFVPLVNYPASVIPLKGEIGSFNHARIILKDVAPADEIKVLQKQVSSLSKHIETRAHIHNSCIDNVYEELKLIHERMTTAPDFGSWCVAISLILMAVSFWGMVIYQVLKYFN